MRKSLFIGVIFILGIAAGFAISRVGVEDKASDRITGEPAVFSPGPAVLGEEQERNKVFLRIKDFSSEKVSKIIDGDTFVLESGQIVRLVGIDAPEKNDCFATESGDELIKLIGGRGVKLVRDVSEVDRYSRLLRYVWIDQLMVNQELVRLGFAKAFPYPPDVKYQDLFSKAEQEAKENQRGLWGSCEEARESANKPGLSNQSKPGLDSFDDKDCKDFKTHAEAQAFFESAGPGDPHRLDADGDDLACESLP